MNEVNVTNDSNADKRLALWGVIVTYRRPEALKLMLSRIGEQTRVPDYLVVVDNGSEGAARAAVEGAGAFYLDAGDNLGPAGGIALGMEHVLGKAGDDDWLVLFDDDDPPTRSDLLSELSAFVAECVERDPATAGVGLVGARYDRRRGVFRRVADDELRGRVPVDYIGGNQFPIYSCRAVRDCGVFVRDYFWGFEEAEFGLRLRRGGYSLYAHGPLWLEQRRRAGRLSLEGSALRNARNLSGWRRYYGVRNITRLARTYATPLATAYVALGGALRGAASLAASKRPLREILLPVRGAFDGALARGGRTVDPGVAAKEA